MSKKTILIVEDEPMIAMLLEDFLDMLGYASAGTAGTIETALDLAGQGGFDAAVLDYNLNGEKVWPVAQKLDELSIPFVFASGASGEEPPAEFVGRPALDKPYSLASVEEALKRLGGAG